MIRSFAVKHMKSESVKIEEEISHLVWERGIRHPPRKIRVKLSKDDDGNIIVSKYQEEKKIEEKAKKAEEKPKEKKAEEKPKAEEAAEAKPKKEDKTEEKKSEEKPKEKKSDEAKAEKKAEPSKPSKKSKE